MLEVPEILEVAGVGRVLTASHAGSWVFAAPREAESVAMSINAQVTRFRSTAMAIEARKSVEETV